MTVVIPGPYYTENIGDHGQLMVLLKGLRDQMTNGIDVVNLTRHIDRAFDREYGVTSILNLDFPTKAESANRWFRGFNPGDDTDHLVAIRRAIESARLMIIPGPMLYDITFSFLRGPIPYYALLTMIARLYDVPQMIFGLSVFEHKTLVAQEAVRFIVSSSRIITVREEPSKTYLERIGVEGSRIEVLPDPALGLERVPVGAALALLRREQIDPAARRMIAIAPRHFYWLWSEQEGSEVFDLIAKLSDRLAVEMDAAVVFVPQATYGVDQPLEDDRVMSRAIVDRMEHPDRAHVIGSKCTVTEALGLYQLCEMVVGMRRHALVFAATQGTPFFAIYPPGYPPIKDFADDLDAGEIGCPVDDLSIDEIWAGLSRAWENRGRLAERLETVVSEKRVLVGRYAELAHDAIK